MFSAKLSSSRPKIQNANNSSDRRTRRDDRRGCARYHHCDTSGTAGTFVRPSCRRDRQDVVAPDRALHRDHDRRERVEQRPGSRSVPADRVLTCVRVDDRRHPEPREQHELEQVLGVAGVHVDRGQRDRERRADEQEQRAAPGRSAAGTTTTAGTRTRRARPRAPRAAARSAPARRRSTRAAGSRAGTRPCSTSPALPTIERGAAAEAGREEVVRQQAAEQEDREVRDRRRA